MGSSALVSVDEYLRTTYRPDRDYIDGELEERRVGEQPHANVQGILYGIFRDNRKAWGIRPLPEQRVQVTSSRYRIPDVCVIRNTDPKDEIITFPPLVCIEVFSKEDTFGELQARVDDYVNMGVQNVWAVHPWTRKAYYTSDGGFEQPLDGVLRIENSPVAVSLAAVFAELDEF